MKKKLILACAISVNILLLCWFKYSGMFVDAILHVFPSSGFAFEWFTAPPLPIGISFYTFQEMSYVVDVYRGDVDAEKSVIKFGVFTALFPQLVAGPIVRYSDIALRLNDGMSRDVRASQIELGAKTFICGLSKKLLLANPMGQVWEVFSQSPGQNGVVGAWAGLIAYAFQIYFDFSGYSDMAIGLGRILGMEFPVNFNYPYISKSITEFWRRWHMTLSSWFRDYLYIPLGGSRKGLARNTLNLFIVWFLTGLWHGAAWNFVLWGLYFAVILTLERAFLLPAFDRIKLPGFVRHIYAIVIIIVGWRLFTMTEVSESLVYLAEMFGKSAQTAGISQSLFTVGGAFSFDALRYTLAYLPMFMICALASTPLPKRVWEKLMDGRSVLLESVGALLLFTLCVSAVASQSYNPFIYFRF
ncbi:MAG: MBOAT family protein [Oscillospiraceae bacterium]|nr:MBOAT family protein [Oscillospiraceae bacterium]